MIAGVFLAAGRSVRFGSDKLLHKIHGRPLVEYSLRPCVESSIARVYVVIAAGNRRLRSAIESSFRGEKKLVFVENDRPESGMMFSLKLGIRAARDDSYDGILVCLADMPLITADIIDALLDRFEEGKIVVPECEGRLYHPRILPATLYPAFLGLAEGERGTVVIERHQSSVVRVPVGEKRNFLDIDRVRDLGTLESFEDFTGPGTT